MRLSVLIATYNQERYIEQAIRSAMAQRTTFDYEIVVADDCSTDRTPDIIRSLVAECPDRFRAIFNKKNLGMHLNYRNAWSQCRGQYVAPLEGDDYWTSPGKLQRQVHFLDEHPECVVCFHNVLVYDDDEEAANLAGGGESLYCPPDLPEICGAEELLQEMFINSSSVVCRNGLFRDLPTWALDLAVGDWPFFLWLCSFGKLGYLRDVMSVYRKHSDGLWNRTPPEERVRTITKMYERINEHFEHRYDAMIRVLIRRWTAYIWCDAERMRWKKSAINAGQQIEELRRKNRALRDELHTMAMSARPPASAGDEHANTGATI
jgi:glycosyltransferase involved in cell wall biosynthesis